MPNLYNERPKRERKNPKKYSEDFSRESIKKRKEQNNKEQQDKKTEKINKIRNLTVNTFNDDDDEELSTLDYLAKKIHELEKTTTEGSKKYLKHSAGIVILTFTNKLYYVSQRFSETKVDAALRSINERFRMLDIDIPENFHHNYYGKGVHGEAIAFNLWLDKKIPRIRAIGVSKKICPKCNEFLTNLPYENQKIILTREIDAVCTGNHSNFYLGIDDKFQRGVYEVMPERFNDYFSTGGIKIFDFESSGKGQVKIFPKNDFLNKIKRTKSDLEEILKNNSSMKCIGCDAMGLKFCDSCLLKPWGQVLKPQSNEEKNEGCG